MTATDAPFPIAPFGDNLKEVTIPDAARLLSVTPETVRRQVRAGTLPARRASVAGRSAWLVTLPARTPSRAADALPDAAGTPSTGPDALPDAAPVRPGGVDARDMLATLAAAHREELARLAAAHRDDLGRIEAHHAATVERIALAQAAAVERLADRIDELARRRWWHW